MTSQASLRRDLRLILADGVVFSAMVGLGESYLSAFALAAGLPVVAVGLVATLPLVAGGGLQLVAPLGVRALGGYRAWVVICAAIQALSFVPLTVMAVTRVESVALLFAAATVYWGAGMATGPAWNAWVGSIVPPSVRGRFFARRQGWMQVGVLVGLVCGGLCLLLADGALWGFALLFGTALAARCVSVVLLARHGRGRAIDLPPRRPLVATLRDLRGRGYGRAVLGACGIYAAVSVSGPYFTPYLLREVGLDHGRYMVLLCAVFVAKIATLPLLGRFVERIGASRLLVLGGLAVVPLPALWQLSDAFGYLLVVQIAAGVGWATFDLAVFLVFFDLEDARHRLAVLMAFNAVHAVVVAAASIAGGLALRALGADRAAYDLLFWCSAVLRLVAVIVLVALRPAPVAVRLRLPALRTLAVRPWGGALLRPIVSVLDVARPRRGKARGKRAP